MEINRTKNKIEKRRRKHTQTFRLLTDTFFKGSVKSTVSRWQRDIWIIDNDYCMSYSKDIAKCKLLSLFFLIRLNWKMKFFAIFGRGLYVKIIYECNMYHVHSSTNFLTIKVHQQDLFTSLYCIFFFLSFDLILALNLLFFSRYILIKKQCSLLLLSYSFVRLSRNIFLNCLILFTSKVVVMMVVYMCIYIYTMYIIVDLRMCFIVLLFSIFYLSFFSILDIILVWFGFLLDEFCCCCFW